MPQLDIYGGFFASQTPPISAQRLINAHVQIPETAGAYSQKVIAPMPGLTQQATTGLINNNRGVWEMAGIPYFVYGPSLFRVNRTIVDGENVFTLETISAAITGTGDVSMSDNGTQLIIVIDGDGFIYNHVIDQFDPITDPDFLANGNPQEVDFVDGLFVISTDTKKFINSAINDGLSYNALDFSTAENDPDPIVAPKVFRNRLYIFGSETVQPFRNIGGTAPFASIQGALLNKGLFAPKSIVEGSNHMYWIGGGKDERAQIWRSDGNTPERVSNEAIDNLLQNLTDVSLVVGWTYSQKGARFIAFRLPDTTLVLDEITGVWHERQSRFVDSRNETQTVGWRVANLATAYDLVWVGDSLDGRIGTIENDSFSEYTDNNILRTLITQPFSNETNKFSIPALKLTMDGGAGNATVADPQIRLSISRNGGRSFGNERSRGIGKVGEFKRVAVWNRNGSFTATAVLKFEWSEPARFSIIRLDARIKRGYSRYAA